MYALFAGVIIIRIQCLKVWIDLMCQPFCGLIATLQAVAGLQCGYKHSHADPRWYGPGEVQVPPSENIAEQNHAAAF